MFLKSIFTGTLITAILVSVLAATRLMDNHSEVPDLTIYEIETITMSAPEEPPLEEELEEEIAESLPQAPIPALDLISDPTTDSVALPLTTATFDPELSVSSFEIDREPAELPVAKIAKPQPKRSKAKKYVPSSKPKVKSRPKPPAPPREVVKSHYSSGELDSTPRALRQGSFHWPLSAKGTTGTVKLLLEINTSGRVKVLSVLSSTDPKLVSPAKRVATGSRYTSPTYRGRPVKTKFYKTYHLQKPRR